ncbi:MAG: alanine--tRNA ligase [Candidatus Gastranaerophilales bacterium]|nr:alanine--tRNA ligase [Candidatus Gastranaerophilales bacterium]
MKTVDEIREGFLSFFEKKHNSTRVKSSSLIPDNPTLLLTSAGMVQFVPYYLGLEKPPYNPARACSCQKCARAGGKDSDIENVGRTPRHHTFFEMLGNFAWGDYYKKEVIPWAWEFVTSKEYLGLDKDRLWVTIFETDDEAFEIWKNETDIDPKRIIRKGKKDNFWGPPGPTGSCGPCSEIHYDLGEHLKCSDDCSIATCECDRWVEIWNMVFTELFQDEEGNQTPLDKKNVDTGMGLERIAMVCQGVESTFETDILKHILNKVCEISGKKYKENQKTDISLRIITDHARCVSFMIADGITPSNEGRGYVLRMILRRALRHGYLLGLELPFLEPVVDEVIKKYCAQYPELKEQEAKIKSTILKEEERFKLTLDNGYKLIGELLESDNKEITGKDAFRLYDTFGFPYELTKEIAQEKGFKVDEEGFKNAMQEQKDRARASIQKVVITNDLNYLNNPDSEFIGYEQSQTEAKVLSIVDLEGKNTQSAQDGVFDIILDKTPFYAECGGQIGDSGEFILNNEKIEIVKTFKVQNIYVHRAIVKEMPIKKGDVVFAKIDCEKRAEITKHHSLAHLLQAALQNVLGKEVHQAGSQVEADKTRYDFTYDKALSPSEIKKVQDLINSWIKKGLNRTTEVMSLEEANQTGAMALFGEKYGETVRVVSFSDDEKCYSKELCAGCHVDNAKDLRLAKIISESASSAGVRRIEVICSDSAINYLEEKSNILDELSIKNKMPANQLQEKFDKLDKEVKDLSSKLGDLEAMRAKDSFNTFISKAKEIGSTKILLTKIEDFAPNAIKSGIELLADKLGESVIVLCSMKEDGTVFITTKVSDNISKKVQAGKIVGNIARALGGNGGGRPQMATGMGKTQNGIDDVLLNTQNEIINLLS